MYILIQRGICFSILKSLLEESTTCPMFFNVRSASCDWFFKVLFSLEILMKVDKITVELLAASR